MDSKDKKHILITLILAVVITYLGKSFTDSYFEYKKTGQSTEVYMETIKALKEVNTTY